VEDDPAIAARLAQLLRAIDGAELAFAASTDADASAWLDANPHGWDLALIDVFLASGHGFRVLRHCRQRAPGQKVVMMSNYDRDPMRQRALDAGADAFFEKASQLEELIDFCVAHRK
jgi:DNA-binding NarL/FixJ family response regulator